MRNIKIIIEYSLFLPPSKQNIPTNPYTAIIIPIMQNCKDVRNVKAFKEKINKIPNNNETIPIAMDKYE